MLPPSVPLSQAGRAAHDLGLAGMLGGAAWRRYSVVNGLGLLAVTVGWAGARAAEASDGNLAPRERRLARAKDALVAATFVSGAANAVQGMRMSKQGPVPLVDGDTRAPGATDRAARLKRSLNVLGALAIASEAGLVAVNAALNQETFRRPPVRRRLRASRRRA